MRARTPIYQTKRKDKRRADKAMADTDSEPRRICIINREQIAARYGKKDLDKRTGRQRYNKAWKGSDPHSHYIYARRKPDEHEPDAETNNEHKPTKQKGDTNP